MMTIDRPQKREIDNLLTVREVRDILKIGRGFVTHLMESGELDVYDLAGNRMDDEWVSVGHNALRISAESLQRYIDSRRRR